MASVFRALDRQLDRTVAVKFILKKRPLPWDQMVALLGQEAKALAQLNHENIVTIFDMGVWRRTPFLVMEYLEGEGLDVLLERQRLSPERAVEIMLQVACGLAHAHKCGIVHRDLKPPNVFILENGRAKILDFGLARFTRSSSREQLAGDLQSPPALAWAGTIGYMAPEQWRGKRLDARTDVWAAGIMLFELLTGELPYSGAELHKLRTSALALQGAPSLLARGVALPEHADRVIARAFRMDRRQRYQNGEELRAALSELQRGMAPRTAVPALTLTPGPERRQVTLLSCHLIASRAHGEDPEDLSERIGAFHRTCAEVVRQHEGRIATLAGERLLACFAYPMANEDDAQRTVRAALQIVRTPLPERRGAQHSEVAHVKIGVYTGLAIVEELPGQQGMLVLQGVAPLAADSLAAQAERGEVLVSQTTYQLLRARFACARVDALSVEGEAPALPAWRVLNEIETPSRFAPTVLEPLTPLVGRQSKLRLLQTFWEQARSGRGQIVMLFGEAGIGKSRVVQAFSESLAGEPHLRMTCQCWSQQRNSALQPVLDLLGRSMWIAREDPPAEKLAKVERALESLEMRPADCAPLVAKLLSIPTGARYATPDLPPQRLRQKTMETLAAILLHATRPQPVLLVIEDLHWADHSTIEYLGFLVDRVESAPILILLTFRPDLRLPWPERAHLHQMAMDRLPPKLAATMVQRAAGAHALSTKVAAQLVTRAEGIPLFVEEMTRMVVEGAGAPGGDPGRVAIPATLHELLLARLDRLGGEGKVVAQVSSVLGRTFTSNIVAKVAGLAELEVQATLARLVDARILLARSKARPARYEFKHALLQEAAYHSLVKHKRQELHQRAARALVAEMPEIADTQPELLAQHHTEGDETETGIVWWDRAGRHAVERSANVEAIAHFERALALLRSLPETPERDARELSFLLALGAPMMAVRGYAHPDVETTYARAHALSARGGHDAQRFPSLLGLWQFQMVAGQVPRSRETAEVLLALAQKSDNVVHRMLACRGLATSAMLCGEFARARDLTQEGVSLYDPDRHRGLAFAFGQDPGITNGAYLAWNLWFLGYPDEALARAEQTAALGRALDHPLSIAFSTCFVAMIRNYRGEHAAARELCARVLPLCADRNFALWTAWATMMQGWASGGLGEHDRGIAQLREGIALWQETGARAGMTFFPVTMAEAALVGGRIRQARSALLGALAMVSQNQEFFYQAELLRLQGELCRLDKHASEGLSEAEGLMRRALETARAQGARAWELRAATSLARLLREKGDGDAGREARAMLRRLEATFTGADVADRRRARVEASSEA
jgi:TOMM system kinase/cyclase fusion protein